MLFLYSLHEGVAIGYFGGDVNTLLDDLKVLKPTIFPCVPRLLNKIYGKVMDGVKEKSAFKQFMFNKATNSKLSSLAKYATYTHTFYDKIVFAPLKEMLGGRVSVMFTGSAPIAADVLNFCKIAFCCPIYEGYGQTETMAAATICKGNDPIAGHVGGPLPSLKIRLRDIPEMEYLHTDEFPRGEICFKGNNIFESYYKNPEKTSEAFDEDGWLRSGDVGLIYPNGSIRIIDRAKNIFKMAQGEYIAPEKLENVYIQCPLIQQIFVHGDSLESFLLAVIVLEPGTVKKWAKENQKEEDLEKLTGDADLKK
jgi:long-chain acyl-CoA synthetase